MTIPLTPDDQAILDSVCARANIRYYDVRQFDDEDGLLNSSFWTQGRIEGESFVEYLTDHIEWGLSIDWHNNKYLIV